MFGLLYPANILSGIRSNCRVEHPDVVLNTKVDYSNYLSWMKECPVKRPFKSCIFQDTDVANR